MQRKQLTVGMKVAVYVEANGCRKVTGRVWRGGEQVELVDTHPQMTWGVPGPRRRRSDYVVTGTITALDAPRVHRTRDSYSAHATIRNDGVLVELDEPILQHSYGVDSEQATTTVPAVLVQSKHVLDTAENHTNRMMSVADMRARQLREIELLEQAAAPKIEAATEALAKLGIEAGVRSVTRLTPGPGSRYAVVGGTVTLTLDQFLALALDRDPVVGSGKRGGAA